MDIIVYYYLLRHYRRPKRLQKLGQRCNHKCGTVTYTLGQPKSGACLFTFSELVVILSVFPKRRGRFRPTQVQIIHTYKNIL